MAKPRAALGTVYICDADADWPARYAAEHDRLRPVLGSLADRLQHYGSTAVPGLAAKPVIDMMAPVPRLPLQANLVVALAGAGYAAFEAGFLKRAFFRREAAAGGPAFHLHLAVAPDWPNKNELMARDWLATHPDAARAYAALKRDLAARFPNDRAAYTDGKTAFLRDVVQAARAARGLPPETDWVE